MAIFNKGALANFFGLADEEEYDYTPQPKTRPEVVKTNTQMRQQGQPMRQQTTGSTQTKEFARPETRPTTAPTSGQQQQPFRSSKAVQPTKQQEEKKVVSMRQNNAGPSQQVKPQAQSNKITIVEPRVYSEAMTIAKRLLASESVLVNFHLIEETQARRIVDFLTGTVYALDGDIKRVGDEIFLCTPANVEIDSSTAQSIAQSQFFDF